jgi:holliday junction DNA helicase RuvA
MIGSLQGVLADKAPPRMLIDVAGVGYEVEAPMSTFYTLPPLGSNVRLRIHHVLREDASLLFGFATEAERSLFRGLLKVSGVGPKLALGVLSGVTAESFQQAVQTDDVAGLTKIPGVGRKTAERLVIEMRDYFRLAPTSTGAGMIQGASGEAINALIALGYKPAEATRLLDSVSDRAQSTEELIRAALKNAGRK